MHRTRRSWRLLSLALVLLTALAGSASVFAQGNSPNRFTTTPLGADEQFSSDVVKENKPQLASARAANTSKPVSVIVKLQGDPLATYKGDIAGLPATNPRVTGAERLDVDSQASKQYRAHLDAQYDAFEAQALRAIPQASVTRRFDVVFGGVAMLVPGDQVEAIATLPGVEAVYPDELLQLETDRSPEFIGAPTIWEDLGGQESAGEGVIVGVLDTGIWPEHPSYSDPDPLGRAYSAPPAPPVGTRACEFTGGSNPGDPFTCNNKLIAAYRFMDTYDAVIGLEPTEFTTARDDNGHGTHTSSTAAGNAGVSATLLGVDRGIVTGIAPRAHVIMYKVCGDAGCFQSDSVNAVEQAIKDGVNVINFSISGGGNPYSDAVELAFLDAYNAGIFVAASAGNSGPTAETVSHRGPWVTTVGASTSDRHFLSTVTMSASNGDTLTLVGASVTAGIGTATDVVNAADFGDPLCLDDTADGAFTGKVVVCERGAIARVTKSFNVQQRGGVGLLLYNPVQQGLSTDNHYIPSVHLENDSGDLLLDFMATHTGVKASFTQGAATRVQGDVMAPFSSRGGPAQTLGISKPDVTAPGVQILAGNTPAPAIAGGGPLGELFQAIQGTSMSSPHVAGSAALIKDLHPDWTPGQIKSALMTTARTKRVFKQDGTTPFTPFDAGSGRIDLEKAGNPGATFDVSGADYVTFASQLYRVNYPSLYIPSMPGKVTVQRTLHSVISSGANWELEVKGPSDLKVRVPRRVYVPAGGDATFDITVDARDVPLGQVRFATLKLEHGGHELHFPITIVRGEAPVKLSKACDPASFPKNSNTTCTVTMANPNFTDANVSMTDNLPSKLRLVSGSVTGGGVESGNGVTFSGLLAGAEPADVSIGVGVSPAGYLSLASLGATPNVTLGDESMVNFNVPSYVFAGKTYTRIGMTSNGYAVVGGGTGADIQFSNQVLPNATRPNNTLAAFWTDLDGSAGGNYYAYTLCNGSCAVPSNARWTVMEWENAPNFGDGALNTFQIWVGHNGVQDVSFTYGSSLSSGDGGALTVGAENEFGNRGGNYYANGVGTLPTSTTELIVDSVPGVPGETRVISFQARGRSVGAWTNYAELTSDTFYGTSIARFSGEVTR